MSNTDTSGSFCVFTTLIGNYEPLNEQPASTNSSISFICLTDDPEVRSDSWEIRPVATLFGMDPIRSQRALKLLPFDHLPEFDCSLYIDNSVLLVESPERLVEQFALDRGIALAQHSFRETVLDEFLEVARLGYDDQSRVFEQLNHYSLECPEVLDEKPLWTGLMLRDHRNPQVRELMNNWHAHVQRYSRRDQLSLNVALRRAQLSPQLLALDNCTSGFHSWPHSAGRSESRRSARVGMAQVPFAASIRSLELRMQTMNETAQKALSDERSEKEALKRALADERSARAKDFRSLELQMQTMNETAQKALSDERSARAKDVEALSKLVAGFRSSTSWRVTAPIRALKGFLWPNREGRLIAPCSTNEVQPKQLHVSPTDERGQALIRRGGDFNPQTLQIWRGLLAECSWTHILDVGANYGEMLIGVQLPKDAKILAFEPNPLIAPYLEWNLTQHEVSAEIVRSAVTDHVGEVEFAVNQKWSGLSHLPGEAYEANTAEEMIISVPATTISAILGDAAAASSMRLLLKVDVEGQEVRVLSGMLELLGHFEGFAALVEVLHLSPSDLAWIVDRFDVELLDKSSLQSSLVPLAPASAASLSAALADSQLYSQDLVLRRKT